MQISCQLAFLQVLDLHARNFFGIAELPVCGQRAMAAIISGNGVWTLSFRQRCRAKAGAGTRDHGRVLPWAVERDKADRIETAGQD